VDRGDGRAATLSPRAFVALGSNLGDREALLVRAVEELRAASGIRVAAVSPLPRTDPVGITEQPRFLNGAVELETSLDPRALLEFLLELERSLGRDRSGVPPGGPRTIDLDLLLYDDVQLGEPDLALPHPRLHERRFVLEPLNDLDAAAHVPGRGTVAELLMKVAAFESA
jgi:2-amino-4-hydroxy-6-hydroxymethyldihydropteridine diphosphokinase